VRQLLALGPKVRAVAPEGLRADLLQRATAALAAYAAVGHHVD